MNTKGETYVLPSGMVYDEGKLYDGKPIPTSSALVGMREDLLLQVDDGQPPLGSIDPQSHIVVL